ncbi:MAG: glycosyltransferase family 4 protein [Lachnospiraceae bacterium]|nr:glycosyltransferase family 4 protein [Lachnospiraceae bacterium]
MKSKKIIRVDNPVVLVEKKKDFLPENYQFIYVGRVSEEKGVELFCQAIEQAKETVQEIEGIVIGDGDKRDELEKKFKSVEFVGWKTTEQVQEYMSSARALVFPSKWYETFGLTVAEALSAGLPCIVSSVTVAAENILDGQNGLIFKPDDLNKLTECIVSVCDDEIWENFHDVISNEFESEYYNLCNYSRRLIQAYCIATEG